MESAATGFYLALNTAFVTGDETPLKPLITRTCRCVGALDAVREARSAGRTIRGKYDILSASAMVLADHTRAVRLVYNIVDNNVVDSTGKVVERYPPVKEGLKDVFLVRSGSLWLVDRIDTYK